MPNRFRADLIDVAWAKEKEFGVNPVRTDLAALALNAGQTTDADMMRGQWGLVTGGVDLPNPTYEWTPFFGLGVLDRNMMMPVQGRERLEGRIGAALFCHDSSRQFMEQIFGLLFNGHNILNGSGADGSGTTIAAPAYAASTSNATITQTTFGVSGASWNGANIKPADGSAPVAIIIVNDVNNTAPDRFRDTWAYIGYDTNAANLNVFMDYACLKAGWNGIQPTGGNNTQYSIHSISQLAYNNAFSQTGVTPGPEGSYSFARPTLVQPSFMLGARFRADDGSNFVVNYMGCKVSRAVFNFEEGNPVNYGVDFLCQDMRHNIGQDAGITGSNALERTTKYVALTDDVSAGGTVPPNYMKNTRVTEQPYFFSKVTITFQGQDIARFRRFSLTVDNQLDPRYYINQTTQGNPREGRQVLSEILEGRRNISFSGSLDLDDTGNNAYPAGSSPTDAQFLRYLLNQSFTDTDIRDMATLKGIGIKIEMQRVSNADAGSNRTFDKCVIHIPQTAHGTSGASMIGASDDVGMILRSASMNVPAPPNIHVPVDIDGFASSMIMEFQDGVVT